MHKMMRESGRLGEGRGTIEFSSDKVRGRMPSPKSFSIFEKKYPVVPSYDPNTPYPNKFSVP